MGALIITEDNFEQEVSNSTIPVLLDFLGGSPKLSMIADNISNGMHGKMKVGKVDVQDQPYLAYKYKVKSLPTMLVIKDGEVTDTIVGRLDENRLMRILNS